MSFPETHYPVPGEREEIEPHRLAGEDSPTRPAQLLLRAVEVPVRDERVRFSDKWRPVFGRPPPVRRCERANVA